MEQAMQALLIDLHTIAGNFETRAVDASVNHEKYDAVLTGKSTSEAIGGTWRAAADDVVKLLRKYDPDF